MLALLLAMGGAWAQEEVLLTTITPTSIDSYDETTPGVVNVILDGQLEYNNTDGWLAEYGDGNQGSVTVTANPGFSIDSCKFYVDEDSYTVTAAPFAVYPYCLGSTQIVTPQPNAQGSFWSGGVTRIEVYGTAQAIKLTPDATGKVWTLAETPDYNLDLNVVYYQKFALKEIPANWQVKVDGVDKTAAIDGDSLKITETAQVLLTPDHPERVKKVILVDEAVLVNIDGITLDITGCTTWAQIIARNSGVIWDFGGLIDSGQGLLDLGGAYVLTSAPYDPAHQSDYQWLQ